MVDVRSLQYRNSFYAACTHGRTLLAKYGPLSTAFNYSSCFLTVAGIHGDRIKYRSHIQRLATSVCLSKYRPKLDSSQRTAISVRKWYFDRELTSWISIAGKI
jgi:hypothetical protein